MRAGALVAALVSLILGMALSTVLEPGVHVERVNLPGDTPALRFSPTDGQGAPVAVLAHGITASKETLFRVGEALAAAGFVCHAIDFSGHGAFSRRFAPESNAAVIEEAVSGLPGAPDVFVGHSMGAYAGSQSVRNGRLRPRLFAAIGAVPTLGTDSSPLLLLAGRFEEAIPISRFEARRDARLVVSPWSDHALEPYDPVLVNALTEAACTTVGRVPPAPPTRWLWRLAGLPLCLTGAVVLALLLPPIPGKWGVMRGFLVAALILIPFAFSAMTWLGTVPPARRIFQELVIMAVMWAVVSGVARWGIRRWHFVFPFVGFTLICLVAGVLFPALFAGLTTLVLIEASILGWIAEWNGTARDGHIAMALCVGYAMGQWMPLLY